MAHDIFISYSNKDKPLLMDRIELSDFASDISITGDRLYVIYNDTDDYEVMESAVGTIGINDMDTFSDIQVVGNVVFITEEMRGVTALRLEGSK